MGVQSEVMDWTWYKPELRKRQNSKHSGKRKPKTEIKLSNITLNYIGKFQSNFLIHLITQILIS